MDGIMEHERHGLWLGMGLGAFMVWNTLLADKRAGAAKQFLLRLQPGYFTALALTIWLVVTYDNTSHERFPIILAAEALLLTCSIYLLRIRELPVLAQGYVLIANLAWLAQFMFAATY